MNQYPNLEINLTKLYENTKEVVDRCNRKNISVTAVTKGAGGLHEVAEVFLKAGAKALGDSRIDNLMKVQDLDIKKWLIRIPMISEAPNVVEYADVSLNSEVKVINALNEAAKNNNKIHKIILMIDHGDLREGWFDLDEYFKDLKKIKNFSNIDVIGIGTNSNCAGAVIPEPSTFKHFPEIILKTKEIIGKEDLIVSGGNSGAYYMLEDNTIPDFINNLRIGELLLFGHETSFYKEYPYLNQDVFKLNAEIIELKNKPSKPIGRHGRDAFGREPVFKDIGIRKRAILGIGKQDIPPEDLIPLDKGISIITASSDHLLVDTSESVNVYDIGDIISFGLNYGSALRASTSDYVTKILTK